MDQPFYNHQSSTASPSSTASKNPESNQQDSFKNKLEREASLIVSGTAGGIADAARDAWSHKEGSAIKLGASALLGAGMSIAAAELALPALALTIGGVAMSLSGTRAMARDGAAVLSSVKDSWNHPNHYQEDKDTFKKSVGPLAVDTAIFTAGGIAGAAIGRVAPVAIKENNLINQLQRFHPETAEHSLRVAQYSKLTTEELGLPAGVQREAYHAGKMHDVGKLDIAKEVLTKPSKLDDSEMALMQAHPAASEARLEKIPYRGTLKNVALDAGEHHEWVNGAGYPNHLTGEQISPVAKTLAPVDVFDAMTAGRAYARDGRGAFERSPLEEVKKTMDAKSGSHFDAQSLKAMWNIPADKMIAVLESSKQRPPVSGAWLDQFKGVPFGRLLDVIGGDKATEEESRLAQRLNQQYHAPAKSGSGGA